MTEKSVKALTNWKKTTVKDLLHHLARKRNGLSSQSLWNFRFDTYFRSRLNTPPLSRHRRQWKKSETHKHSKVNQILLLAAAAKTTRPYCRTLTDHGRNGIAKKWRKEIALLQWAMHIRSYGKKTRHIIGTNEVSSTFITLAQMKIILRINYSTVHHYNQELFSIRSWKNFTFQTNFTLVQIF